MDIHFKKGFEKIALNTERRKYKEMSIHDLNPELADEIWSAKIDGAHTVMDFKKGELPHIYGHRISKRTNAPIEYTPKIPLFKTLSPFDAVLRGELYYTKDDKVQRPEVVTSVLNSLVEKSLQYQKEQNITPHIALFDIDNYGTYNRYTAPKEKIDILNQIIQKYPELTIPDTAFDSGNKIKLRDAIIAGSHPQTSEGLVVYKGNDYIKAKTSKEYDVYIRSIFKETSAREPMAGGFEYSWEQFGPIVGKVGTGFSFEVKKDMLKNPSNYIGKVAIVRALGISKNNVLLKPSYRGLHVDKNIN